jgi:cytochrome c peroxidase
MTIEIGQRLPEASFTEKDAKGIHQVDLAPKLAGRRVAIFGVPGAFTPTCDSAHLPSFIRNLDALKAQGVDEVICVSVNDPHVMRAWAEASGAEGITMLADAECTFTEAIGMRFDAPPVGLIARSVRYTMLVEDGVVTQLNMEAQRGVCELTAGEALLDQL